MCAVLQVGFKICHTIDHERIGDVVATRFGITEGDDGHLLLLFLRQGVTNGTEPIEILVVRIVFVQDYGEAFDINDITIVETGNGEADTNEILQLYFCTICIGDVVGCASILIGSHRNRNFLEFNERPYLLRYESVGHAHVLSFDGSTLGSRIVGAARHGIGHQLRIEL